MRHYFTILSHEIRTLLYSPSTYIAAVFFLGVMGFIFASILDIYSKSPQEMPPAVVFFQFFWFPVLFMVPLPGVLLIAVSFKMKLAAAWLATHTLDLIGIPAQQAGSTIHVPGMSVIVDDSCSGLPSLISLIALATLWTSLLPRAAAGWKKLAIIAASIPIALVANMSRILVLVLLSAIYGPQIADSFIHYGSGLVVFGIAIAALAWLGNLLVTRDT